MEVELKTQLETRPIHSGKLVQILRIFIIYFLSIDWRLKANNIYLEP